MRLQQKLRMSVSVARDQGKTIATDRVNSELERPMNLLVEIQENRHDGTNASRGERGGGEPAENTSHKLQITLELLIQLPVLRSNSMRSLTRRPFQSSAIVKPQSSAV